MKPTAIPFLLAALAASHSASARVANEDALFDLSIEELVNLEVTSVSGKSEPLAKTASAVYVITRDDIRRHGIRSLPEALRLAPGLSVTQVDANKWAVGARGFTGRFSNKLLVMMDGRLLYTPSFSGVYWDTLATTIEEIERIEVIRGPGAVVWGTNAVAGVINIITAAASSDDGSLVTTGLSPEGATYIGAQHSAAMGDSTAVRLFGVYEEGQGSDDTLVGLPANDDWTMLKAGFSTLTELETATFRFDGQVYDGGADSLILVSELVPPYQRIEQSEADYSGAFLKASWSFAREDDSETNIAVYVDHSDRFDPLVWGEKRTTYSGDIHRRQLRGRHELSYGASVRQNTFDFTDTGRIQFLEEDNDNTVANAFIQDEYHLIDEVLSVTFGLKAESNDLSPKSVEWMPSARLFWNYRPEHSFWAAVTRAIRSPSIADRATRLRDFGPTLPPLTGDNVFPLPLIPGTQSNPDFVSETSINYEAGVRGQFSGNLSYDLALYYVKYDRLRSVALLPPICEPSGVSVAVDPSCLFTSTNLLGLIGFTNDDSGHSHGAEAAVDWQAGDKLRLRGAVSYNHDEQNTRFAGGLPQPSFYPDLQASFRALLSLNQSLSVALWFRYTDEIEAYALDDYWQAHLNLAWDVNDKLRFSVGGRNLLDDGQIEFISDIREVVPTAIPRTVFANVLYTF